MRQPNRRCRARFLERDDRNVDEMLGDEPHLELVGSQHLAHEQVVGSVVTVLARGLNRAPDPVIPVVLPVALRSQTELVGTPAQVWVVTRAGIAVGAAGRAGGEDMERPSDSIIVCMPYTDSAHPSRRYSAGRICGYPGCDTRLSTYNATDRCALHSPLQEFHMRAPRRRRHPATMTYPRTLAASPPRTGGKRPAATSTADD